MQRDELLKPSSEYVEQLKEKQAQGLRLSKIEQGVLDTYDALFATPTAINNAKGLSAGSEDDLGATLRLKISEVKPYDGNPRREENEQFAAIKAWLRKARRPLVLSVTRRPGEPSYMLCEGGNTRLRVLQELYDETGDEVFRWILAHYVPWGDESDVLISHLAENAQRDDLSFWDLSCGLADAKRRLEAESGRVLSLRNLEQALAQRGLKVVVSTLSSHLFAATRLHALGDAARVLALNDVRRTLQPAVGGMLDLVRRFEHAEDVFWQQVLDPALARERERFERAVDDGVDGDARPTVRVDGLLTDARERLAQLLGVAVPALDKMLRMAADHANLTREELLRAVAQVTTPHAESAPPKASAQGLHTMGLAPPAPTTDMSAAQPAPAEHLPRPDAIEAERAPSSSTNLAEQAARLAALAGLAALVRPHDALPLGYWIELPAPQIDALPDMADAGGLGPHTLWWLLASVSGQLLPDIARRLPEQALWRQMLEVADEVDQERVIDALRESVGLEAPLFGFVGALLGDTSGSDVLRFLERARATWGPQAATLAAQRLRFLNEEATTHTD